MILRTVGRKLKPKSVAFLPILLDVYRDMVDISATARLEGTIISPKQLYDKAIATYEDYQFQQDSFYQKSDSR